MGTRASVFYSATNGCWSLSRPWTSRDVSYEVKTPSRTRKNPYQWSYLSYHSRYVCYDEYYDCGTRKWDWRPWYISEITFAQYRYPIIVLGSDITIPHGYGNKGFFAPVTLGQVSTLAVPSKDPETLIRRTFALIRRISTMERFITDLVNKGNSSTLHDDGISFRRTWKHYGRRWMWDVYRASVESRELSREGTHHMRECVFYLRLTETNIPFPSR